MKASRWRNPRMKGGETMSNEVLKQRIAEAWALIRKGDTFGIGRRFLKAHGVM